MLTRAEFSKKYAPLAIKVSAGTGIYPETVLSFAIVESQTEAKDGNYYPGTDLPAKQANNYFGIKKYPQWFGPVIELPTSKDGIKRSKFVVYDSIEASFAGFIDFLKRNPRYAEKGVFSSPDFQTQIVRIGAAGYEENPKAASIKSKVAESIKKYIDEAGRIVNDSKNLLPFFFASIVIVAALIYKATKK
jgi:flagellum-specific peptidoglycan hydrolase FlgJ